jgi:Flp pilus assembly protein protease CpaA
VIITSLLAITVVDIYRHRIPNPLLILLTASILLSGNFSLRPQYAIAVLLASLFGYWKCGVGAGDVKLLFLIALFLTPADETVDYWIGFSIIGFLHILLKWSSSHSIKGNIALAPALCGAVLYISSLSGI